MKDFIIIGAGISGLNLAKNIIDNKLGSVTLIEKSRGIGGRMATRRTLGTRFDHGAQFYRLKPEIQNLHQTFLDSHINHLWFTSMKGEHWCANEGMTSLSKAIINDLSKDVENFEILLEKLIYKIHHTKNHWEVLTESGESFKAKNLIITAPIPQCLTLLERSQIAFPEELKNIQYSKALIGLLTLKEDISVSDHGYIDFLDGDFFSITDQKFKGISKTPAITVTMSSSFSERKFDLDEALVINKIVQLFLEKFPEAEIVESELKKWRYCQVNSVYKTPYIEIAPRMFLIGDGFGGSSILGAIRSSIALFNYLNS